ncbi:MAG: hypothetical protein QOK05_949 [Chloroflexota bacterium]|jgi:AcrR family transcriptional regulator|nr:hypothetical protein [Chloroflexota bacterium]
MSTQKRPYELRARAEQQAITRQRIVAVTAELHDELGPARTTVAEIARRAGVQRLTVYNHFPDERGLYEACGEHWMSQNPPPDPSDALELRDPAARLRAVLVPLYRWYRRTARAQENMQRDRLVLPAFDAVMRIRVDQQMNQLGDALSAAVGVAPGVRAIVGLALNFWTWRTLSLGGLGDEDAAAVMVKAVSAAGDE